MGTNLRRYGLLPGALLLMAQGQAQAAPTQIFDAPGNVGGVTQTTGSYQLYTVTFTATASTTELSFLLRNDANSTSLDNVSLVQTGQATNLLLNGNFESGPGATMGSVVQPLNWTTLAATGTTGTLGTLANGVPSGGLVSLPYAGSFYWHDGTASAFDGIAQSVATTAGQSYTLTFQLGSQVAWASPNAEVQIYAGTGLPTGLSITSPNNIDTLQAYYLASNLATIVNPVFQGGTLRDDVGATYAQSFTINNAGGTIDQDGTASTFSGVFSNAASATGALTVANSASGGSVTLTGTNTYTGATTINSGATLALSGGGSIAASSNVADDGTFSISGTTSGASIVSLSGGGSVALGSKSLTLTTAAGTFSGAIGGTGGLTVSAGTETLSGANTYSGTTTISSGATLAFSGSGGASSSAVSDSGNLSISGTTSGASIASLSGSGAAALGAQTLTLTNAAGTFAGVISGSGGGVTVSSGTETLTGANTYSGATSIASGATLVLSGSGGVASSSGVTNNGNFSISGTTSGASIANLSGTGTTALGAQTLTFTGGTGVYNGTLGGTGGVTVTGGSETLNGSNTYTGATNISGGTLAVGDAAHTSAAITSNVTVQTGGTLRGHGTITGSVTNNGGTVAPGGSVGTTTVNGNYTQSSGGTLSIELSPSASSLLAVNGSASLAGTLSLTPDPGLYARGVLRTILTATSGVSGAFSSVVNTAPSVAAFNVQYTANAVQLLTLATTNLSSLAMTRDQANTAAAIDRVSPNVTSGAMSDLLNSIVAAPLATQKAALDQMAGHVQADTLARGSDASRSVMSNVLARLDGAPDSATAALINATGSSRETPVANFSGVDPRYLSPQYNQPRAIQPIVVAWMQGLGDFASVQSNGTAPGYSATRGGGIIGLERATAPHTRIGAAISGSHDIVGVTGLSQNGTMDAYALALYGSYGRGRYLFDGAFTLAYDQITSSRRIDLLGTAARGRTNGVGVGMEGGVGYRFILNDNVTTVTPRLGLTATYDHQFNYTETGAPGDNLVIGTADQRLLRGSLGATLASRFHLADTGFFSGTMRPEARLGWLHEMLAPTSQIKESFAGVGNSGFTILGANPGRDAVSLGGGLSFLPAYDRAMTIYLRYDGTLSTQASDHSVVAGLRLDL